MLVLGRKAGEYVMIGKDIMVKVVKSDDGDLRLAIDAPKCINIIRGEIYEDKLRYMSEKELFPIQTTVSNRILPITNNWTL
jgi:carbon storage regulator